MIEGRQENERVKLCQEYKCTDYIKNMIRIVSQNVQHKLKNINFWGSISSNLHLPLDDNDKNNCLSVLQKNVSYNTFDK